MMHVIFASMIGMALIFGLLNGRITEVSAAAMEEATNAVRLMIELCGSMCLWSGVMRVAQKSGLTDKLSRAMGPILRLLFKPIRPESAAGTLISMNMVANLIGLGNAVTPLGIAAMRELEKYSTQKKRATDNMVLFVVLNTASLQIIPTTTAMLRLSAGSQAPMEIIPAVWIASLCSVISGILAVKILAPFFR